MGMMENGNYYTHIYIYICIYIYIYIHRGLGFRAYGLKAYFGLIPGSGVITHGQPGTITIASLFLPRRSRRMESRYETIRLRVRPVSFAVGLEVLGLSVAVAGYGCQGVPENNCPCSKTLRIWSLGSKGSS